MEPGYQCSRCIALYPTKDPISVLLEQVDVLWAMVSPVARPGDWSSCIRYVYHQSILLRTILSLCACLRMMHPGRPSASLLYTFGQPACECVPRKYSASMVFEDINVCGVALHPISQWHCCERV